jgi:hypothetical protein
LILLELGTAPQFHLAKCRFFKGEMALEDEKKSGLAAEKATLHNYFHCAPEEGNSAQEGATAPTGSPCQ